MPLCQSKSQPFVQILSLLYSWENPFLPISHLPSGNLGIRRCPQRDMPGASGQPMLPLPEPGLPVPTVRRGAQPGTFQQEVRHRRGGVCDHQGCGECWVRPCHSREGLNSRGTLWLGTHTPRKSLGQLRAKPSQLPSPRCLTPDSGIPESRSSTGTVKKGMGGRMLWDLGECGPTHFLLLAPPLHSATGADGPPGWAPPCLSPSLTTPLGTPSWAGCSVLLGG